MSDLKDFKPGLEILSWNQRFYFTVRQYHSLQTSIYCRREREEPTIHLLKSAMENLGKRLAQRIVNPYVMKEISSISAIDVDNDDLFKNPQFIFLGGVTKATLNRLLSDGCITGGGKSGIP